jgi:hypothetical protein
MNCGDNSPSPPKQSIQQPSGLFEQQVFACLFSGFAKVRDTIDESDFGV